jgi:cytochrome c oxidase subunit 2
VSHHHRPGERRSPVRRVVAAATAAGLALVVTGCSAETSETIRRGWLPGTDSTTTLTNTVRSLWVGSWIAALVIGIIVWGLTIWCVVKFRRRKGETGLPPQLRYNVPLEVLYTIVPLFMIGVLFFYTARDQAAIERRYEDPDVKIEVVAKRWAWDFNYTSDDVYSSSVQVPLEDESYSDQQIEDAIPVLYLPVDRSVEITLHSRDVIHSFYVPAFSYKKDMVPGRTNFMSVTPTEEGTYVGKCAELCGEYHASMLFNVQVVSDEEYQTYIQSLRDAGQTGGLEVSLGQSDLAPNQTEDAIGQSGGEEN